MFCIFLGYGDTVRNKARTTFPNNWDKGEIKKWGQGVFLVIKAPKLFFQKCPLVLISPIEEKPDMKTFFTCVSLNT